MFLPRDLIVVLVFSLSVVYVRGSSPGRIGGEEEAAAASKSPEAIRAGSQDEHLEDPITELKRLSPLGVESKLSEEELDEVGSAQSNAVFPALLGESPLYEASQQYLLESLVKGKRRFDSEENNALASASTRGERLSGFREPATGDKLANLQLLAANLNQMDPAASLAFERMQMIQNNANLLGRGRKSWPGPAQSRQVSGGAPKPKRQNSNRRSASSVIDGGQAGATSDGRSQLGRSGGLGRKQKVSNHYRQQESRKRSSRPLVRKEARNSEEKEDDIFNDDPEDKSSDRRSDDDGEEPDEDDYDNSSSHQPRGGRAGGTAGSRPPNRKMKQAASEGEDLAPNEDSDEDSDSSTNMLSLGKPSAAARKQAKRSGLIRRQDWVPRSQAEPQDGSSESVEASQLKNSSVELQAAAGHHHGHHGHYYQFVEVPKKKAWKFGFKRGNHKHEIERHEKGHKHKFHSSFKWHAKEKCKKKKKCKSVGKMTWEYKHAKKHHK